MINLKRKRFLVILLFFGGVTLTLILNQKEVFYGLELFSRSFSTQEKEPPPGEPYRAVSQKPTGWFKTGQEADLILYAHDFNDSGGASSLNHPAKVATDGKHLLVADTYNHRVLIWNQIPTNNYTPADLVLGQKNMKENTPDLTQDKLRWPTGVATDGKRVVVADAYNNRVLIWNSLPTENGQKADLILGQPDFTTNLEAFPNQITSQAERKTKHIWWPWDVMIYQNMLFVISLDGSLLIWKDFPTQNYQSADLILGQKDFSERFNGDIPKTDERLHMKTPRAVSFDGKYLVIGDYNAATVFVYKGLPTQNGQKADFILQPGAHKTGTGVTIIDGIIYATMDQSIYAWKEPISKDDQEPDFILGKQSASLSPSRAAFNSPYGLASQGNYFFVADSNNNRVLIYNNLPKNSQALSDVVLGQKDFDSNDLVSRKSRNNPFPVTDGNALIIGDDYNGLVQIYNQLPDESLAEADIYNTSNGGSFCAYDGKLYCATGGGLSVWENLPNRERQAPDFTVSFEITKGVRGIAVDKKGLYIADAQANQVLVFSEKPSKDKSSGPDFVLGQNDFRSTNRGSNADNLTMPIGVSSDGEHLVVGDNDNKRVLIWDLPIRENGQKPNLILGDKAFSADIGPLRFEGPAGVVARDDKLFVADNGNNRILIWSKFPQKTTDAPDIVLGQKDFYSKYPSNAKDGLFLPMNIAFDGHYLWVGEFKWSDRLLRFSVQP